MFETHIQDIAEDAGGRVVDKVSAVESAIPLHFWQ